MSSVVEESPVAQAHARNICGEIPLEDLAPSSSCVEPSSNVQGQRFVLSRLSAPAKNSSWPRNQQSPCDNLDDHRSTLDWETIAPTDELGELPAQGRDRLSSRRNFALVLHAQDILNSSNASSTTTPRRNTILGPPEVSLPKLPSGRLRGGITSSSSFISSSSFYSDSGCGDELADRAIEPDIWTSPQHFPRHPAMAMRMDMHVPGQASAERVSKTSSSENGDPFRYDAGPYTAFLQPAAERNVSDALHRVELSAPESFKRTRLQTTTNPVLEEAQTCERPYFYHSAAIPST